MNLQTQNSRILKALQAGDKLTPLAALKRFGSFRLGARIFEIREAGYNVKREFVKRGGKHVAQYSLWATPDEKTKTPILR